jgi:hypothetical protein
MNAPNNLKSGLKCVAYLVLFVVWTALHGGCSEAPKPSPDSADGPSKSAVVEASPLDDELSLDPIAFDPSPKVLTETPEPKLPSTFKPEDDVLGTKPSQRAAKMTPGPGKQPADPGESKDSPPAEPAPETSPAAEQQAHSAPATVAEAVKLLDLRKLPRMAATEVSVDTPTQVSMMAKASVAEAKEFYTDLLDKEGWKIVPPAMPMADSEDYAQLNFAKAGFDLGISLYKYPDTGLLSVGLNNYGNFDVRKLPQPAGSAPLFSNFNTAMYVTDDKVPQLAEACTEQLETAGWQLYTRPFTAYTEDTEQRSLTFKQNGLSLSAFIGVAPAQMNRTTVQYSVHMLGDELPVPAEATKIEFSESPLHLTCENKADLLGTLEFFRQELAALGWQEKGTGNQAAGEAVSVFQRSEGLPIVLKITRLGEDVPTSVAIAEFEMPHEVPIETVTENEHQPPAVAAPAGDGVEAALPEGIAGLLTYEDWLEKNKYKPGPDRLEQYAAEMEKLVNGLGGEPAEGDDAAPPAEPDGEPMGESAVSDAALAASAAAIEAVLIAEGRVQTNDDEILTFVELTGNDFSDKQMKLLAGMGEMTYLNLSFTQVTDAGLKVVADMPKLEKLYLSGLKISDAGLKVVENLKDLDLLIVSQTPITDAGLVHLKGLENLERLSLMETKVTDKGLKALLGLPKLKALDLSSTAITDAAIPQLVQMRMLEELNLANTKVSPAGVKTLQAALPECDINE